MRKPLCESGVGIGYALFPLTLFAAPVDDMQRIIGEVPAYLFALFVIVVAVLVYFLKSREDKHAAPLNRVFEGRKTIHSVGPDTPVMACAGTMTAEKIGALIVMDGDRLIGIFTERDALNKVLAAGLDPRNTKVSEVMTTDPYCVPPTITVGAAMQLVTTRRFRHLPIVENGKVLALVSSGDLTHWLVKDQMGEIRELVEAASRS